MWFKTKRENELLELCELYRKKINDLENRESFITVKVPLESEQGEYWRKLSLLREDNYYLFYFTNMKTQIINSFRVQGKEFSEFFRGKLDAINDILTDAKNARQKIESTTKDEV